MVYALRSTGIYPQVAIERGSLEKWVLVKQKSMLNRSSSSVLTAPHPGMAGKRDVILSIDGDTFAAIEGEFPDRLNTCCCLPAAGWVLPRSRRW